MRHKVRLRKNVEAWWQTSCEMLKLSDCRVVWILPLMTVPCLHRLVLFALSCSVVFITDREVLFTLREDEWGKSKTPPSYFYPNFDTHSLPCLPV